MLADPANGNRQVSATIRQETMTESMLRSMITTRPFLTSNISRRNLAAVPGVPRPCGQVKNARARPPAYVTHEQPRDNGQSSHYKKQGSFKSCSCSNCFYRLVSRIEPAYNCRHALASNATKLFDIELNRMVTGLSPPSYPVARMRTRLLVAFPKQYRLSSCCYSMESRQCHRTPPNRYRG